MITKILVPVDINTLNTTQNLCQEASKLGLKFDAQINLLAVIPDYGMSIVGSFFPEEAQDKLKAEFKDRLQELSALYFSDNKVNLILRQGKKASQILREEGKSKPDLIMIGCRSKKSRNNQRLLGSCSSSIADRASCSVFIVRCEEC